MAAMAFSDLFYVFVDLLSSLSRALSSRQLQEFPSPRPPTPLEPSKTFYSIVQLPRPGFHGPATPTPTPQPAPPGRYTRVHKRTRILTNLARVYVHVRLYVRAYIYVDIYIYKYICTSHTAARVRLSIMRGRAALGARRR